MQFFKCTPLRGHYVQNFQIHAFKEALWAKFANARPMGAYVHRIAAAGSKRGLCTVLSTYMPMRTVCADFHRCSPQVGTMCILYKCMPLGGTLCISCLRTPYRGHFVQFLLYRPQRGQYVLSLAMHATERALCAMFCIFMP